jgi:hypothetical protein
METISTATSEPGRPDYHSVRAELRRILLSPQFCKSPRLSRFLEYVVESTLAGKAGDRCLLIEDCGCSPYVIHGVQELAVYPVPRIVIPKQRAPKLLQQLRTSQLERITAGNLS